MILCCDKILLKLFDMLVISMNISVVQENNTYKIQYLLFRMVIICLPLRFESYIVLTTHLRTLSYFVVYDTSPVTRKPVFWVCDQVRHIPIRPQKLG